MESSTELVPLSEGHLTSENLTQQARAFAEASRSDNTKRAYAVDWKHFTSWCAEQGRVSLPATVETVVLYVTAEVHAKRKVATITRRLASISQAHQLAHYPSPTKDEQVRTVMKGVRRTLGTAQDQAAPITVDILRLLVTALPMSLTGERDRALLLVGFAGALRRSELVALQVADVQFVGEGMVITVRRSKTDQEGQGNTKGIPFGINKHTCPVRALKAWLKTAGITEGPLFRPIDRWGNVLKQQLSDRAVARIVQRTAAAAGLDPEEYSGHSLRAGLVTSAAAAGLAEHEIMSQSGHKSTRVLRGYIRRGSLFRNNAAGKVGL